MKYLFVAFASFAILSCGGSKSSTSPQSSSSTSQTISTTNGIVIDSGGTVSGLPAGYYVVQADPIVSLSANKVTYSNLGYCAETSTAYTYQTIETTVANFAYFKIIDTVLSMHTDTLDPQQDDSTHLIRLSGGPGIQGVWVEKDVTGNSLIGDWITADTLFTVVPESYFQSVLITSMIGVGSSAQLDSNGFLSAPFQGSTFRESDSIIIKNKRAVGGKITVSWGGRTCSASMFSGNHSAADCAAAWARDSSFYNCSRSLVPNHPALQFCDVHKAYNCGLDCANMADTICN